MANEKWLIDAKSLMDAFRAYMVERYDREKCVSEENCKTCDKSCLWRRIVSVAPTVDAVEVVRCRDCEHYKWIPNFGRLMCTNFRGLAIAKPDDFCPYGERKDCETDGYQNRRLS